jgi:phage regulator Rha-like protein
MAKVQAIQVVPDEVIINKIYLIRGQKVMIDSDLAELYGVETKVFNQAVKRNIRRFPKDFMFILNKKEFEYLRSQNVTSNWGGRRYMPRVFTEQGVAMLSSILNSERAIDVNIFIIRVFTKLREMLLTHKDILLKLEHLERQLVSNSDDIQVIFTALKELIHEPTPPREPIGFKAIEAGK